MNTYGYQPRKKRRRGPRRNFLGGWSSLLLCNILPLIILNGLLFLGVTTVPKCTLTIGDTYDYLSTEATLVINSRFPTKTISLSMDAKPIELVKIKKRTYRAVITQNGVLEANVANINGMSTIEFEHVNILDDNPPTIPDYEVKDGVITLTFSDTQSGLNLDSIYALDSNDVLLEPLSFDRATATVSYLMDPAGIRVYAQDMAGNQKQGTFTSVKEGEGGILENGEADLDDEAGST